MAQAAARRSFNMVMIIAMILVAVVGVVLRNSSIESESSRPDDQAAAPPTAAEVATQSPMAGGSESAGQTRISSESDFTGRVWKGILYLALILAAILLGAYFLKHYGGGRLVQASSPDITILGRRYISPKQSLAMVRVRHKELLLGITDQSIRLLYDFTPEEQD